MWRQTTQKWKNKKWYSKKRTSKENGIKGISHHKICVVSSIDENDNLLLKIAGLSRCTTDMLRETLGQKLHNDESINIDSASAYQDFCKENQLTLNAIPSGFHSNGIFNISEINGVHSQLETWFCKFKGGINQTLTRISRLVCLHFYYEKKIHVK